MATMKTEPSGAPHKLHRDSQEARIASFLEGHTHFLAEGSARMDPNQRVTMTPYSTVCELLGQPQTIGGVQKIVAQLREGTLKMSADIERLFPHRFGD